MPLPVAQTVRHRKECPNSPILGTTERPPHYIPPPPLTNAHWLFSLLWLFEAAILKEATQHCEAQGLPRISGRSRQPRKDAPISSR